MGIKVYAACTGTDAKEWKKYIKEHKLDWINVYDPSGQNEFRMTYDVYNTPKLFILDENKRILVNRLPQIDQFDDLFKFLLSRTNSN